MASASAIKTAIKRHAFDRSATDELADKLFRAKRRVYRRTLLETANYFGRDVQRPRLSESVEKALRDEAAEHAKQIATTFNRDLAKHARDAGKPLTLDALDGELSRWANARQRQRAEARAVTETYGPYADAVVSFFRDVGMEPEFEFGGHPELGDAPPACSICQAIAANNPHSLEAVIEIGLPHIACRQQWHWIGVDARELPVELNLGQTLGGIVGGESLLGRHDNDRDATVRAVESLSA